MTFATDIAAVPMAMRGADAIGFLPPVIRTLGHLTFVLACISETDKTLLTPEDIAREMEHAKDHWLAINYNDALSVATAAQIASFGNAITAACTEFDGWDDKARQRNLRLLINAGVSITTRLDRELVGLTGSDAGTSL